MPQVVLQVEDLSVEKVVAELPPEGAMLPPVRTVPTLSEGELAVGEPSIPAVAVQGEGAAPLPANRTFSSEAELGAGTPNAIFASIGITSLGPDPRLSLQFHHESMDGFGGHDPVSGFNTRDDSLNGGLRLHFSGVNTELAGGFKEDETGLQQLSMQGYSSALTRAVSGSASFSGSPADWLTVKIDTGGGFDSFALQGASPLSARELRIAPAASAQARWGVMKIGLETRYWYRNDSSLAGAQNQLHRAKVSTDLSFDFSSRLVAQASAGWFWNSAGLSLFPFSLALTGTPLDFFTLSLEGGYKIAPYDMHDILSSNPLALPASLADDRGWYGVTSAQLSFSHELSAKFQLTYMRHDAMPVAVMTLDPTGLFPVQQSSGVTLSTNAGVRWGITQAFSFSAGWSHEFMDRLFFTPTDAITAGLLGLDPNGRFGGNISMSAGPTADGTFQLPVLHVSGFWRIVEPVKLQIDGDDLLAPLLGGPRWDIARTTYITPGFRISGSLGISL
jgi:hypothetical protein